MIIDDLHIKCLAVSPDETDAPLVVDSDTASAAEITFQSLQPITRWGGEIAQFMSAVQLTKLAPCNLLEGSKSRDTLAMMQFLGIATAKRPDHPPTV